MLTEAQIRNPLEDVFILKDTLPKMPVDFTAMQCLYFEVSRFLIVDINFYDEFEHHHWEYEDILTKRMSDIFGVSMNKIAKNLQRIDRILRYRNAVGMEDLPTIAYNTYARKIAKDCGIVINNNNIVSILS
jgi:hypothetical protein